MKKTVRFSLFVGLLAILMMLSACSKSKLTYDPDKNAYVGRAGTFYRASSNYLAVGVDKAEELAKLKREGSEDILLYPICKPGTDIYMNTELWMADGDYHVYYAEGVTLPKLWEMEVSLIDIVRRGDKLVGVGEVENASDIAKVIDRYQNGTAFSYNDSKCNFRVAATKNYELAFTSQAYQGLYYMLNYYEYEKSVTYTELVEDPNSFTPKFNFNYTLQEFEGDTYVRYDLGKTFIYDREAGLCYPVDDLADLFFVKE